jgi:ketosteroid isomerase-like protein
MGAEMSTNKNRQAATKFILTMKEHGGFDERMVTDDLQWFSPNQNVITAAQLKAFVETSKHLMPECPTMTILGVAADKDRVAVEAAGQCQLTNGKRYDNHYHFVILFRDGRICAVKEYCDTKLSIEAGLSPP